MSLYYLPKLVLILLILTCDIAYENVAKAGELTCEKPVVGFHVATNDNSVFNNQAIELLTSCAGLVSINSPWERPNKNNAYTRTVARLHSKRNDLKVLIYAWVTVDYDLKIDRIGATILNGLRSHNEWLLKLNNGHLVESKDGYSQYADVANDEYRKWVIGRIVDAIENTNADGILIDMAFRAPSGILSGWCRQFPEHCNNYASGMDALFSQLKKEIGHKLLIYNGLFAHKGTEDFQEQLRLLKYADGAFVEYFGMVPKQEVSSFDRDILGYYYLSSAYPNKLFLFNGRRPRRTLTRKENEQWGRYLYASYMMIRGRNTLFKYQSDFQVPSHIGWPGALDILPDRAYDIGEPLGTYKIHGCLYYRKFSKGIAAFCRHDANRPGTMKLEESMISTSGKLMNGLVKLMPGEAVILRDTN